MKITNKTVSGKEGNQNLPYPQVHASLSRSDVAKKAPTGRPKATLSGNGKMGKVTTIKVDGIKVTLRPHLGKGMLSKRELARIFG
jgi:hypothetical protein